jgi:S-adenosylmethionine hydrolase
MKLITLTSDMGLNDHYVASLKASILSRDEQVNIIDISHSVRPFDIAQAAFILISCFEDFPKETVHIIAIDSEPIVNFNGLDGSFPCVLELDGQYVVSNDNGFFGAFLGVRQPDKLWRLDDVLSNPKLFKFPSKNMLIPAAIRLLNGEKLEEFASEQSQYRKALLTLPAVEENLIKGTVVYIDSYGNAITNIDQILFESVGKNNPYIIYFRKKDYYIDHISNTYNEVPTGEKVGIFNEKGFLEIAINRGANGGSGGAEKLFGLKKDDTVRVEFTPRGSKQTLDELF